jgi:hypothetical protein
MVNNRKFTIYRFAFIEYVHEGDADKALGSLCVVNLNLDWCNYILTLQYICRNGFEIDGGKLIVEESLFSRLLVVVRF